MNKNDKLDKLKKTVLDILNEIDEVLEKDEDKDESLNEYCDRIKGDCDNCKREEECDASCDMADRMEELDAVRGEFIDSLITWMTNLPFLPDEFVADIEKNGNGLYHKLNYCFAEQIEPLIAFKMLEKIKVGKSIGLEDILGIFGFIIKDAEPKAEKEDKNKAKLSDSEKKLIDALKKVRI